MSKFTESFSKDFFVGVFVTVGFVLFLVFLFTLRGAGGYLSNTRQVRVSFDYLGGLKAGQPVLYAGYQVGSVESVSIQSDSTPEIIATLSIPGDLPVYEKSRFYIASSGLVGDKVVDIIPPSKPGDPVEPGQIVQGNSPVNVARVLGEIQKFFGRGTKSKIRSTIGNAVKLTENLADLSSTLRTVATKNEDRLNRIVKNVSRGAEELPSLITRADSAARSLNRLARDLSRVTGKNKPEIRKIIRNLNATSRNLKTFSREIKNAPSSLFWGKD